MTFSLLLFDAFSVFLAFFLAYALRIRSGLFTHSAVPFSLYLNLTLLAIILTVIVFLNAHLYHHRRGFFSPHEFFSVARAYLLVFIIVMAVTFLTKGFIFSRLIIFFAFLSSIFFSSFFRWLYRRFIPVSQKRVLVVGDTKQAERLAEKTQHTSELHYHLVGIVADLKHLDRYAEIVDIVFLAMKNRPQNLLDLVERYDHISFKIVPDYMDLLTEPINFHEFLGVPLIELRDKDSHRFYFFFKRFFDMIVSFFLLLFLSPLFFLLVLTIKCTSKGPFIIRQERIGYQNKPFIFYKFRTMYTIPHHKSLENEVDYLFKKKNDPRVTPLGRFLRRFCLDELPQLYNVLKGDMSLVGPRPHFASEMKHLEGAQRKRFLVRPGMTGLWQISGRHDLNFDKTIYLDLYYVKHCSFLLDLEILFKTIPAILFSRGLW